MDACPIHPPNSGDMQHAFNLYDQGNITHIFVFSIYLFEAMVEMVLEEKFLPLTWFGLYKYVNLKNSCH